MSTATSIPPIAFEALPGELAEAFRPRVERLGYLGEFFQRTAHQPAALLAFATFTEAARRSIPPRLAETIALTVATAWGDDYERNQHERLAVRNGLSRDWVAAVERLQPDAQETTGLLATDERATQRYVLAALERHGHDCADEVDELVSTAGVEATIGVMFVTGRFAAHTVIANSLGLAAPVPSIFEDGFDGD